MGLDTTHDAFHGPYSSFSRFRHRIANQVGIWNLDLWWASKDLPEGSPSGEWPKNEPADPIDVLLAHSDCDGHIEVRHLIPLAERLEGLADVMRSQIKEESTHTFEYEDVRHRDLLLQFARGCRQAYAKGERIEFW